jgi:hypothetical protein
VNLDQASFFGLEEHLERLSKMGDPLEVLEDTVDFEYFRPWLLEVVPFLGQVCSVSKVYRV